MNVRVRYAPSPTGLQHIGGIRTALFNYLFARSHGGKFILRIEDTDRERYSENALEDLYTTLKWLNIKWDEGPDIGGEYGPYVQSERTDLYRKYAEQLIESGDAYYCFCTTERLEQLKSKDKKSSGYDRLCRDLTEKEAAEYRKKGKSAVIRFKVPLEGSTVFHDELLGDIKKKNKDINPDPVLLKSDGFPTYHLASIIDDHFMEITHILRAQEWLPSAPLHVLLYKAFDWKPPAFCHLPMVLGKDGQKLSKRHGSTSVKDFREAGYIPEALLNYISLVGWSYDDSREFFTIEELEKLFSLDKLNKAPGIFDYKKLDWFNGQYIRKKSDDDFIAVVLPYLIKDGIVSDQRSEEEQKMIREMVPLVKERLKTLSQISELVCFLFKDIKEYEKEDFIPKKLDIIKTVEILKAAKELTVDFSEYKDHENEERFKNKAEEMGIKLGDLLMPLRVAVTGSRISPPLFGSIRLFGIDKSLKRIDRAINLLAEKD